MDLVGVAVLGLAVARLTRVVTTDKVGEKLRIAIIRRAGAESLLSYFLVCPWCVSIYTGTLLAAGYVLLGDSWIYQLPALALAASYIAGALDRFTDGE